MRLPTQVQAEQVGLWLIPPKRIPVKTRSFFAPKKYLSLQDREICRAFVWHHDDVLQCV